MKCDNCGTENPDEALFCKNCGARLDGNVTCPHCGKLLPADSKFCMYCGYRFGDAYAQTNAPAAGAYGAGYGYVPAQAYAPKRVSAPTVLKYVSDGLAMLAALFAFIFMFLIGVRLGISGMDVSVSTGFFYFFGDAYDALDNLSDAMSEIMRGGVIMGTVATALILLAVSALFISTAVKYILTLFKKTKKGMNGLAAATFFSYIAGIMLFLACISGSGDVSADGIEIMLNGATIAGIVLGGLFLLAAVVTDLVAKRETALTASALKGSVTGLVAVALMIVLLCLPAFGVVSFRITSDGTTLSTDLGITNLFSFIAVMEDNMNGYNEMRIGESIITVMFFILFVGLSAASVTALSGLSVNTEGKGKSLSFGMMIMSSIFAVLVGIMQLLGNSQMVAFFDKNIYDLDVIIAGNSAVPIVMIVFGVLLLATAIVFAKLAVPEKEPQPVVAVAEAGAETAAAESGTQSENGAASADDIS